MFSSPFLFAISLVVNLVLVGVIDDMLRTNRKRQSDNERYVNELKNVFNQQGFEITDEGWLRKTPTSPGKRGPRATRWEVIRGGRSK